MLNADSSRALLTTVETDFWTQKSITRVAVVDTTTGAQLGSTLNFNGKGSAEFNADGTRAVIVTEVSGNVQVSILNTTTGRELSVVPTVGAYVHSVQLNATGDRLVVSTSTYSNTTGYTATIMVLNTVTLTQIGTTRIDSGASGPTLQLISGGSRALITTTTGTTANQSLGVTVIDTATGAQIGSTVTVPGAGTSTPTIRLIANDSRALITTGTGTGLDQSLDVAVIDTERGAQIGATVIFSGTAESMDVDASENRVAVTTSKSAAIIDTRTGTRIGTSIAVVGNGWAKFNADGTRVLVLRNLGDLPATNTAQVLSIDAASGKQVGATVALSGGEAIAQFVARSTKVLISTVGYDPTAQKAIGYLSVLDIASGTQTGTTIRLTGSPGRLTQNPDHTRAVITTSNVDWQGESQYSMSYRAAVIDIGTGTQIGPVLTLPEAANAVIMSANGVRALILMDTQALVLDTTTGARISTLLNIGNDPDTTRFNTDATTILTFTNTYDAATGTTSLQHWATDILTGQQNTLGSVVTFTGAVTEKALSVDGSSAIYVTSVLDPASPNRVVRVVRVDTLLNQIVTTTNVILPTGGLDLVSSADTDRVALVSYDYGEPMSTKLVAIDTTTGTQIGSTIGLIPGPINYPVMSADGKLMLLYTYGPVNYSGKTLQSIFRLA